MNPKSTTNKYIIIAAVALGVCVLLAAVSLVAFRFLLSMEQDTPVTLTLEQAKNELRQVEDEIASYVPANVITTTYPRLTTSRVLFTCDVKDAYYWPGSMEFAIDPNTDSGAIISSIHDAWMKKSGWKVTWLENDADKGAYSLDLLRDDGLHFNVLNLEGNKVLHVGSFTACFTLSDYDPNAEY